MKRAAFRSVFLVARLAREAIPAGQRKALARELPPREPTYPSLALSAATSVACISGLIMPRFRNVSRLLNC